MAAAARANTRPESSRKRALLRRRSKRPSRSSREAIFIPLSSLSFDPAIVAARRTLRAPGIDPSGSSRSRRLLFPRRVGDARDAGLRRGAGPFTTSPSTTIWTNNSPLPPMFCITAETESHRQPRPSVGPGLRRLRAERRGPLPAPGLRRGRNRHRSGEPPLQRGNKRQPRSETTWSANRLDKFETAGKPVTDYTTKACVTDDFYARANAMGYVPPWATSPTPRDLDVLRITRGHEPD